MTIHMPKLEEGRIYRRGEVEAYIGKQNGTSDFDLVTTRFPTRLDNLEKNGDAYRDGEEMVLRYHLYPLCTFDQLLLKLDEFFLRDNKHRERVEIIVECLRRGETVYPVFIQENDPQLRIIEGNHRAVALRQLGSHYLPSFQCGYRNWFVPDGPDGNFVREDDILSATIHDVWSFFRHATRIDYKGIAPASLSGDRLPQCKNTFAAKHREGTIGAVTFTARDGEAMISTVYVLRQYRRKGVGYRLCERALLRIRELGIRDVSFDPQSIAVSAILDRLGRARTELREIVKWQNDYLPVEEL